MVGVSHLILKRSVKTNHIMPMASKTDHHLHLNNLPRISATQPKSGSSTGNTSPIEPPSGTVRSPFGHANGLGNMNGASSSSRLGAGSPSHELGSRLYSKRFVFLPPSQLGLLADVNILTVHERSKPKKG